MSIETAGDHGVLEAEKLKVDKPKKYNVVLYNDDTTSMEFVVTILVEIFNYNLNDATAIMWKVHEEGKGIAGTYSYQIAQQKVDDSLNAASAYGYRDFKVKIEDV